MACGYATSTQATPTTPSTSPKNKLPWSGPYPARAAQLWKQVRQLGGFPKEVMSPAQSEVIIANAYFVPGRRMRSALVRAARRGVSVRLLLQGRYEYFMQWYAARPIYGALLAAGVEIYEYAPSFLHAKVAVVDGEWSTVGSSNLDPLSLLLAHEANVMMQDRAFSQALRERLVLAMEQGGKRMDPRLFAQRPLRQRVWEWAAFALMRIALALQGKKYL